MNIVEPKFKDKTWLTKQYVINNMSALKIAKLCNVSSTTIYFWLKKFNIPRKILSDACKGKKISKQTKLKMSKAQTGRRHSKKTKEKIRKAQVGKPKSKKHRENLSKATKGRKRSKETKEKISKSMKGKRLGETHPMFGKKHTEEARKKMSDALKGENNPMYGIKGKDNHWYGKAHSKETKEKIRKAFLGKPKSEEHRKKMSKNAKKRFQNKENHPMWGKTNKWGQHTEEVRKEMSKRVMGKNNPMYGKYGNKNPMWGKKGKEHPAWVEPSKRKSSLYLQIRNCEKCRAWRKSVYERDGYACQVCGDDHGGNLNADHIKPLSVIVHENKIKSLVDAQACSELWDVSNGRTLCIDCHKKTKTYAKNLNKLLEMEDYAYG